MGNKVLNVNEIGSRISTRLTSLDMRPSQLVRDSGCKKSVLSKYINNKVEHPSVVILDKLTGPLKVDLDWLCYGSPDLQRIREEKNDRLNAQLTKFLNLNKESHSIPEKTFLLMAHQLIFQMNQYNMMSRMSKDFFDDFQSNLDTLI